MLKRLLLSAALALGLVAPVDAATYYVRSNSGKDTNNGTATNTAFKTFAKAVTKADSGDVIYCMPGTYIWAKPNNWVTIQADTIRPAITTFDVIDFSPGGYTCIGVQVHGITTTWLEFGKSVRCGFHKSVATRGMGFWPARAALCRASSIGNGLLDSNLWGEQRNECSLPYADSCAFLDNVINLNCACGGGAIFVTSNTHYCQWLRNKITITKPNVNLGTHMQTHFGMRGCTWTDNRFTFVNNSAWEMYGLNLRDGIIFNTFLRDTFEVLSGASNVKFEFLTEGRVPLDPVGCKPDSDLYNYFDSCYFNGTGLIGIQTPSAKGWNFNNCVFYLNNGSEGFQLAGDSTVVRHCTFIVKRGVAQKPAVFTSNPPDDVTPSQNMTFAANIVVSEDTTHTGPLMEFVDTGQFAKLDSILIYSPSLDSLHIVKLNGILTSISGGCTGTDAVLCDAKWSYPALDSTTAHPRLGSYALNGYWGDAYVGAYSTAYSADILQPRGISDLTVASYSKNVQIGNYDVTIQWTATADSSGGSGTYLYEMRYSTATINAGNFAAASSVSGLPLPVAGGTVQNAIVPQLAPSTTYYFAIRVRDVVGNWSAISNVASVKLPAQQGGGISP